jgi:hypothetical protein
MLLVPLTRTPLSFYQPRNKPHCFERNINYGGYGNACAYNLHQCGMYAHNDFRLTVRLKIPVNIKNKIKITIAETIAISPNVAVL